MSVLRPILENSLLLRPWMRLAQLDHVNLSRWLAKSRLLGRCIPHSRTKEPVRSGLNGLALLFAGGLALGVALLFVLLSFASTGVIGLATWGLLAWVIVSVLCLRPAFLTRLTSIDLLVVCFLGSAALSTACSSFWHTSVIGLAKMMTFVAGYVVFRVLHAWGGARLLVWLLGLLMLIGLGESLVGFYQHINHIQPLATWSDQSINPELQMDRVFGTLKPSNPNLLAGFLIACLAAALGSALVWARRQTVVVTLASLGIAGCIMLTLVWTGSRGGFLALGVMFLLLFGFLGHLIWRDRQLASYRWLKPLWLIVLVISLVGATGGVLSSEKIRARAASIFSMRDDSSISYRFNVYNSAMNMAKDNPLVGIGPGNGTFKLVYGLYMVPGYNALGAYSVPLEIAVEQGLIGLTLFLSLLMVLMLRTALVMDSPQCDLREKLLCGALLMGILGSFAYGIFDTIWYRPSVNLLFWFMVAALAQLSERYVAPCKESCVDAG